MNSRWLIPTSLATFAIVAALLWGWLSHAQKQIVLERVMFDELAAMSAARRQSNTQTGATKSTNRAEPNSEKQSITAASKRRAVSPAINWQMLADRMDDRAVMMRVRANDASYINCATGWVHLDADRPLAALHEFDRVLARDSDAFSAIAGRADALCRLGRLNEAADSYVRLIRIRPDDATARYNFGSLLYRLSRFTEASQQFRELVSLQPDHARGWYNLAGLAQRIGRLTEARDAWQRFTALAPNVADGWFNLGLVLIDLEEPIDALFCFACSAGIDPDDIDSRVNMAAVFDELGDRGAAVDILNQLRQRWPCDALVADRLAVMSASGLSDISNAASNARDPAKQTTAALPNDEDRR